MGRNGKKQICVMGLLCRLVFKKNRRPAKRADWRLDGSTNQEDSGCLEVNGIFKD